MTLEIAFLFLVLIVMVYLFLSEKIPVDLTAFLGLGLLILTGYVTADQAFTGFASSAVITMLGVFILGAALLQTGVADSVGSRVHAWVGSRELSLIVVIMLVAGVLSSFMNNIAAVAVLMPAVASIARRAKLSPSRLFMPLSFGAILGGTMTLVGTPPNILVGALLAEYGLEPFGLFDFTPVGAVLLLCGVVYMVTLGRRFLPVRETGPKISESRDLAEVYQVSGGLFSIRIPEHSGLDGLTLSEAQLGETLGIQVLAITRQGEKQLAPEKNAILRSGDVLLAEGQLSDLRELLRVQSVRLRKAEPDRLPPTVGDVCGIRALLARRQTDSPKEGRNA